MKEPRCPWIVRRSCWRELGTDHLRPQHIPCWNGSIGLPRMKVNTPAKLFLDKADLPSARSSHVLLQAAGDAKGGDGKACDARS